MTSPLPVLPAALFKPLECDPTTCQHPGVPLPSIDRLSAAVSFLFWRKFDTDCVATAFPKAKEQYLAFMMKGSMADAYRAPKDKKMPANPGEEGMATLLLSILVDLALGSPLILPSHTPWISNHYQSALRLLLKTLVTEIGEVLDSSKEGNRCLHDVLAGIEAWSAARTLGIALELREDSSGWNRHDQQTSGQLTDRQIALRESKATAKAKLRTAEEQEEMDREREEWELSNPPETAAQAFDMKFQRYLTSNNFLLGHRLVFNSFISPLNLLVYLLQTSDSSTTNPRILSDVLAYCAAPPKTLRDRLAIAAAPFLWTEHESRLEPIRNPAPGFLHYILEDPDRNNPEQTIENNSIVFHNVKLVVEYRVCPPDTCSGQAPVVDNYPRVEFLIGKLVDLHFTRIAIPELDEKITEHRTKVLSNFLRRVTTFACESDDDKSRILALLEDAFVETAVDSTTFLKPDLATVRDVLALVGATFRYAQKQATGATTTTTPCLCDMTHLCDQLDAAVRKVSKIVDGSLAKKPDLALLRVEQLQAKIARGVRSGSYDKAIWRGPWKLRSPGFLEFIRRPLNEIMLRDEHRVAYIMVWRHLFAVVGSARLFEEASFAISVDDRSAQKALECIVRTAFEHDMTTGEISGLNEAANELRSVPSRALILDQMASFLDPAYWHARLNSSKMRLALADASQNRFQYSRAVYDCTVALHYGGDNPDAYYRRGIALARLELWEKAIIDFEKALAIDPENELVKEELALAKLHLL